MVMVLTLLYWCYFGINNVHVTPNEELARALGGCEYWLRSNALCAKPIWWIGANGVCLDELVGQEGGKCNALLMSNCVDSSCWQCYGV